LEKIGKVSNESLSDITITLSSKNDNDRIYSNFDSTAVLCWSCRYKLSLKVDEGSTTNIKAISFRKSISGYRNNVAWVKIYFVEISHSLLMLNWMLDWHLLTRNCQQKWKETRRKMKIPLSNLNVNKNEKHNYLACSYDHFSIGINIFQI